MTADLTPAQAARLEDVERVARAMWEAMDENEIDPWDWPSTRRYCRRLAVAAIDVMRGATDDGAIGRVEALHVPNSRGDECAGCRAECLYCEGEHEWPCPTVRAVGAPATTESGPR